MKKKTKVNKKKLDSLLLVLLLTAVLLIMSTYAWFTANRTVSVEGFNVNVSTTSGLQISADGEDWKTVLELTDLQRASTTYGPSNKILNQLPVSMEPMSSALNLDSNGRMEMFYGKTIQEEEGDNAGEFYLHATKDAEKSYHLSASAGSEKPAGYYIAFDIFLKSGNSEKDLNMSGSVQELKNNVIITDFNNEKGITNAARVALVVGEHTTSDDPDIIRELKTNKNVLLWEPNSDYHTQKGVDNAFDLGIINDKAELTANSMDQKYIACDGVKATIAESDTKIYLNNATEAKNPEKFKTIEPTWKTSKNTTAPELPMPKYTYEGSSENALLAGVTKFRVYMWIEGQDIDCENYASGSDMQFDLSFSLGNTAASTD